MLTRSIGDRVVSAIGLGAMNLSREGRPSREQAFATIRTAVEAGVTLIDTADAYGIDQNDMHHNERLVAEALRACGDAGAEVLVATKGGHTRRGRDWAVDGRPQHLRKACDGSLRALGVEQIGLYQLHRPDPGVPYEETIGALRELQDTGKIRLVGISNVSVEQIDTALLVLGPGRLASVQNEFSPRVRNGWIELALCDALEIAFLLYSPLGGSRRPPGGVALDPEFTRLAKAHDVSVQQVVLAWELALANRAIPIPGCSRPATILDCVGAATLALEHDELETLTRMLLRPKGSP
jgi:aryl-alcohol dehydrogenase-like predicted oxidoreductase